MAKVFISGSSDGIGFLAGKKLAEAGHQVVLHARNGQRAEEARARLPECAGVIVGDVSGLDGMRSVAEQANASARFDAVIHNVGVGFADPQRRLTQDGLVQTFAVNVVAPYVLTARMARPDRLIYLSSDMHAFGNPDLGDLQWERRSWDSRQAYSDSKLYDAMLAMALARRWPDVLVNAVHPGWVPTNMGGQDAPDDLSTGAETQVWLANSNDPEARVTGGFFHHGRREDAIPATYDIPVQDQLLARLAEIAGVVIL